MRPFDLLRLGVAMCALGSSPSAYADDATFYTATYVEVVPPSEAPGAALLRQYREAAGKDAGHRGLEILQRIERPNQFVILAAWKDQAAFEAHAAAGPAKEVRDKLRPLLASPNDERWHVGLSVARAAPSPAGAIHVVTHVDVIPPRKDDGVALLRHLAEASRKDAGNVRFDVVQQTNRPNHFTIMETWKDRPAFDAHAMAAPTRQFRDQLAPMSGALYDERLYVPLN